MDTVACSCELILDYEFCILCFYLFIVTSNRFMCVEFDYLHADSKFTKLYVSVK